MTTKVTLKITAAVAVGGRRPGDVFRVDAVDDVPRDLYWRSRIKDGEAEIVSPEPAEPVRPAPTPKAAKQKD